MTRQIRLVDPPVLASTASVANRPDRAPVTVVEILQRAVEAAVDGVVARGAAGRADVLAAVDLVITPRGTWSESDPGRAAVVLAGREATGLRSIVTEIGVLQQSALHRAVDEVRAGARAVLVLGGEAKHSTDRAGVARDERGDTTQPDEIVRPHGDLVHPVEIARRVYQPVQQYALMESALAAAAGRTVEEQERHVARLWADGSRAVEGRDDSWRTVALTEDEIIAGRVLATPYRRLVVSSWTVDQAVAILVTAASTATAWGLAESDVVGLVGSATTDHVVPLVARRHLDACPAFRLGAEAIEASSGVHPSEADVLDLYSCFPSAVQIAARDLGVEGRGWTATGGMAAFGGPFNSYALHGIAAVADELRTGRASVAATTCVSGLLSKAGVGVWCAGPGPAVLHDVTDADLQAREQVPVDDDVPHGARVVASTVCPGADGTTSTIEIVEAADGRRGLVVRE